MALQTFHTEFGEHEATLTAILVDGEPWFRGTEAATTLGYKNPQRAIRDHVEEEDKGVLDNFKVTETVTLMRGNEGTAVYISESGLYSLIMRSKLQHAKSFQRWVLKDVLPTIRRTGGYTAQQPVLEEAKEPVKSAAQQWDAKRALLDALKSSHSLAQIAGIKLGDMHRKVIENAINEVLLPLGQEQRDMIDAAEFLKRKGHTPMEIARLAGEFGRALKTVCERTGQRETITNHHEFGGHGNDIRMYHAHGDSFLLDAVYYNFQRRELYQRVCTTRGDTQMDLTLRVEEALQNSRGTNTPKGRTLYRGKGSR